MLHITRRRLVPTAIAASTLPTLFRPTHSLAETHYASALLHAFPGDDVYPESVAVNHATGEFYVGSVKHGTIFRGKVGNPDAVSVFSQGGADGRIMATGLFYQDGKLIVVGRQTGLVFIYETATGRLLAKLDNGRPGGKTFLNDVVFMPDGSAYATDSVNPILWKIAPQGTSYTLSQFMTFEGTALRYVNAPGAPGINLNGITATSDGRFLIVNKRNENLLFRIDLQTRQVTVVQAEIDMLKTADGIYLEGDTLYAAQNLPRAVGIVRLTEMFTKAVLEKNITHPSFAFPTSVAKHGARLLVVSAQFDTLGSPAAVSGDRPPLMPFWLSELQI